MHRRMNAHGGVACSSDPTVYAYLANTNPFATSMMGRVEGRLITSWNIRARKDWPS